MSEERVLTPEKKKEMEEFEKSAREFKEQIMGKKTESFNANSIEDMERAKREAEKNIGKIKEKSEGEELVSDIKEKASLIASQKTNEEVNPEDLSLKASKAILKLSQLAKEPQNAPQGYAPLSSAQLISSRLEGSQGNQGDIRKRQFSSFKEMIDSVREQEKHGKTKEDKEMATQILRELFLRHRTIGKEKGFSSEYEGLKMPSIEELTRKKKRDED